MQVGKYFTLSEFTRSHKAMRYGIDNSPNDAQLVEIKALSGNVLDPLRKATGPVSITSGLRVLELNRMVGSSDKSQHTKGQAADIKIKGMTAEQMARKIIELDLPFDQLIVYAPSRGGHVHVSHKSAGKNRRDIRRAPASGNYPAWDPDKGPPDLT